MDFGTQSDMESIQGGLDPSGATGGTTSDFSTGDPSLGDDDYTVTNTPTEFRTVQNYTQGRGATATNPYPESFFSQMFGAENVNYTNILGGGQAGLNRVAEINELRFRQATGLPSIKTGKQYQAGDYYIGQDTTMGTVKAIPDMTSDIMKFMPGGGIMSAFIPQKGLPENDPRYQQIMNDRAKEAKEPSVFNGVTDYLKNMFGIDNTSKPVASPVDRVKINELAPVFNSFDNSTMGDSSSNYEKYADMTQTFRNINDATKGVLGPDGMPVPFFNDEDFRLKLGVDNETQDPRATFTYNFNTA